MNSKIQAIIFDMDGVLIDSEGLYMSRLQTFVRNVLQVEVPTSELLAMIGAAGPGHWNVVKPYCPVDWNLEIFRTQYRSYNQTSEIFYPDIVFPGTLDVLENLANQGYRLALATSTPTEKAVQIMKDCGFDIYMEFALSGDMFRESKPNPEIYIRCLERFQLPAETCLIVEDSPYGIEAGKKAGISVIARTEGRFSIDQTCADYQIGCLGELPDLIENLNHCK